MIPAGVRSPKQSTIHRLTRFRFWCTVCRSGSPGESHTAAEAESWKEMHERTAYHRYNVGEYLFFSLIGA